MSTKPNKSILIDQLEAQLIALGSTSFSTDDEIKTATIRKSLTASRKPNIDQGLQAILDHNIPQLLSEIGIKGDELNRTLVDLAKDSTPEKIAAIATNKIPQTLAKIEGLRPTDVDFVIARIAINRMDHIHIGTPTTEAMLGAAKNFPHIYSVSERFGDPVDESINIAIRLANSNIEVAPKMTERIKLNQGNDLIMTFRGEIAGIDFFAYIKCSEAGVKLMHADYASGDSHPLSEYGEVIYRDNLKDPDAKAKEFLQNYIAENGGDLM